MFSRLLTSGVCAIGVSAAAISTEIPASARSFATSSTQSCSATSNNESWKSAKSIYDFTAKDIHGKDVDLKETYEGKVVLIVNVASR